MASPRVPAWNQAAIVALITPARLSSYMTATGRDIPRALALYEWNTHADAALVQTAALIEVIVRNALDRELDTWAATKQTGTSWFDIAPLDVRGRTGLQDARSRATSGGRQPEVHGKVIAELNFGFWRILTASKYHANLWVPALHRAFPLGDNNVRRRRVDVEQALKRIGNARNRGAHHEPVHRRNIQQDLHTATTVAAWISPDAGAWVHATSTIPAIINERILLRI